MREHFKSHLAWVLMLNTGLSGNPLYGQQASTERDDIPNCTTSFSTTGELPAGYYATVSSPVVFDDVLTEGQGIDAFGGTLQRDQATLVFAYELGPPEAAVSGAQPEMTTNDLSFLSGGEVVYQCVTTRRAFQEGRDTIEQLAFGDCQFSLKAGMTQLVEGHWHFYELPRPMTELSVTPTRVLDATILDARLVGVIASSAGLGQVVWAGVGPVLEGGCPLAVSERRDQLEDKHLCRSVDDQPVRLAVGEEVDVMYTDAIGERGPVTEGAIADQDVADFRFVDIGDGRQAIRVGGLSPGTTSLATIRGSKVNIEVCAVEVTDD